MRRAVRDLAGAAELVAGPGERVPDAGDEPDGTDHDDERGGADERSNDRPPPGRHEPLDRDERDEREDGGGADDEQDAEEAPVRDAVGVGAAVLDEGRPREGPAGDDDRRGRPRGGRRAPPRPGCSESQSATATTTTPASRPARDCVSRITSTEA